MELSLARGQSGQATTEYILLLAVIVGFFLTMQAGMQRTGVGKKLMSLLTVDYAKAYQYGHPKASGPGDSGGVKLHPRMKGEDSFRIFLNPRPR